jgi:hypothetical protein
MYIDNDHVVTIQVELCLPPEQDYWSTVDEKSSGGKHV